MLKKKSKQGSRNTRLRQRPGRHRNGHGFSSSGRHASPSTAQRDAAPVILRRRVRARYPDWRHGARDGHAGRRARRGGIRGDGLVKPAASAACLLARSTAQASRAPAAISGAGELAGVTGNGWRLQWSGLIITCCVVLVLALSELRECREALMESRRSRGLARFFRQVHALFLKNLSFQVTTKPWSKHFFFVLEGPQISLL